MLSFHVSAGGRAQDAEGRQGGAASPVLSRWTQPRPFGIIGKEHSSCESRDSVCSAERKRCLGRVCVRWSFPSGINEPFLYLICQLGLYLCMLNRKGSSIFYCIIAISTNTSFCRRGVGGLQPAARRWIPSIRLET